AKEIGKIVCELGAGRIEKEDEIDYSVGLILRKKGYYIKQIFLNFV
ncbi:MAG TPA: hypothetical protein H9809_10565, partial [Candidatus Blautia pullicola]|nr:hypothetical protein [Candidatus Blautia pullicola]